MPARGARRRRRKGCSSGLAACPKGGQAEAMQAENEQNNNEASTLNHPSEQGAQIAPIRQSVALLWVCKFCKTFHTTRHLDERVAANWDHGSKREPLRCVCRKCGKRNRLRSENHDLVWAEVPWRRIGQRKALAQVAESLNILSADSDYLPLRGTAYAEWNRIVGYKGKKMKPMPFKRWEKRGGA